jgi:hypothetical protein
VLSFRRRSDEAVGRALPTPADKGARLRAIAWLAGNLARDQASPFLRATGEAADRGLVLAQATAPGARGAVDSGPRSASPSPTEPPPVAAPSVIPPAPRGATATLEHEATPAPVSTEREWSVTAAGGLAVLQGYPLSTFTSMYPTDYQLELVKHRPDHWLWGAGVELGPNNSPGGLALGGVEHRWGKLRLDAIVGLGLERAGVRTTVLRIVESPTTAPTEETTLIVSEQVEPYGRAFVTLSRELTQSWDLVLRVGAHLTFADAYPSAFFASAVGLRLNLP